MQHPSRRPGDRRNKRTSSGAAGILVTIAADNPETVDGLHAYMRRAGVSAKSTRRLDDLIRLSEGASAVVLFPDDFPTGAALATARTVLERVPEAVLLLVTSTPLRYTELEPTFRSNRRIVIVPRPAWGWTILDGIKSRLTDESD
jgi:hypothetical protein